ncbi:MAG: TetR/AcrR family transcriptional regulator [Candidatus Izemoplasmatales bacterium]|jgi:AcrR family transcriptional regulator|nr:TetR/AcrR family transcriptional regulator [Candidatus Izemoplasmatales bacterium]
MQKNQDIKLKIIHSAEKLLREKGNFTIKDIAEDCYINIAAVNYHFGSKENLLNLVLREIVNELKELLKTTIDDIEKRNLDNEETIEEILNLTYTFALENIGIINYLFMQNEYQDENVHILIKEFFTDSPFTKEIYSKLAQTAKTDDPETLKVKYLLLFSSFAIPLFIQLLGNNNNQDIWSLKNSSFQKKYIKELIKIIY